MAYCMCHRILNSLLNPPKKVKRITLALHLLFRGAYHVLVCDHLCPLFSDPLVTAACQNIIADLWVSGCIRASEASPWLRLRSLH